MRFEEIADRAKRARAEGSDVVLVLGLGFVGTAVVANLSRTMKGGRRAFFVIGLDQDQVQGREKASSLDAGKSPTYADDPSLAGVIAAAAVEPKGLVGTVDSRCISLADVVVSCINLDLVRAPGQTEILSCPTDGYAAAMRAVGAHMRPGTLVCIESTLPLGMSDRVIYPALCEGQRQQGVDVEASPPLLAFCYERVMPGPNYLDSVNNYWRAYAGIDERSADSARDFLSQYVNVEKYPLWRHKTIRAAEMAKLLENSYRATNIAFIEEWARLAEGVGVDLFDVIHSVRLRKGTHDNMMFPGLGVGGYCLTKDALLAAFGAETLLGTQALLPFSRRAILTNERMPLRSIELAREHFDGRLEGKKAAILGVTYRAGVADTRSSPAETVAKGLLAEGVEVRAWDPLVPKWEEVPQARSCREAAEALRGADIAVICLPDADYKTFLPALLAQTMRAGSIVVDPWNMVAASIGPELARKGVRLEVFGRGDLPEVEHGPGREGARNGRTPTTGEA
jgi:nucleotide sugar dehydrogenase